MIAARVAAQQSLARCLLSMPLAANKDISQNEFMEGFQKALFQLNSYII